MKEDRKLNLSRRKVLGGLGTIGIASAGAGLGTSAYFSDTESFENNVMTAGELDLKVGWQQVYYGPNEPDDGAIRPRNGERGEFINAHPDEGQGDGQANDGEQSIVMDETTYTWNMGGPTGSDTDVTDKVSCSTLNHDYDFGEQDHLVELDDVKPGDGGQITFNLCLCDNPGYIWLMMSNFRELGGETPEPEPEPDNGELAENLNVYVSYDENCNSRFNDEDSVIWSGTLAEARETVLSKGNGLALSEDCFDAGCYCFNVGWEVPHDVGNEIQGDSVAFDLGFYTEQCRHNPDPNSPISTTEGSGWAKQEENFNGDGSIAAGARARRGADGTTGAWELAVGDEPGVSGSFDQEQYAWTDGATVPWTVSYDESADELTLDVDGTTVSSSLTDQPDGRMAVQAKARDGATVEVENVSTDLGPLVGPTSVSATDSEVAYIVLGTTLDGNTSFSISGDLALSDISGVSEEGANLDVVFE